MHDQTHTRIRRLTQRRGGGASRSQLRAITVGVILGVGLVAASCELPFAAAGAPCWSPGNYAQDNTHVVKCEGGRWQPGLTVEAADDAFEALFGARPGPTPPPPVPYSGCHAADETPEGSGQDLEFTGAIETDNVTIHDSDDGSCSFGLATDTAVVAANSRAASTACADIGDRRDTPMAEDHLGETHPTMEHLWLCR